MVNARIERWSDAVKDALTLRFGAQVTKAYDANSDVFLTISTGNVIIKFEPVQPPVSGAKDSLGLAQTVYAPHVIKVLFDAGPTAGGTGPASEKEKFLCVAEVIRLGAKVQLYSVDGGADALATADFSTATLVAEYESLEWGGIGNL